MHPKNQKRVLIVSCILSFAICSGFRPFDNNKEKAKDTTSGKSAAKGKTAVDSNEAQSDKGPVVKLSYGKPIAINPSKEFLYFIPLISPVSVIRETSENNSQQGGGMSYEKESDSKSFYATCGFTMEGNGFQKYIFDPAEMIARNLNEVKGDGPLTNILGWIKFEGAGTGLFEVSGTIDGSEETVTEVIVNFNEGGQSPVTAGIYSIKPQDKQYKYENKYNEIVVRINTLTFKKDGNNPKMAIKISSIRRETEGESFGGNFKAFIANFFIKPLGVDKLGNDAMLNLGKAITDKRDTFTFPKANNIKEDKIVPAKAEEEK